MPDRYTLIRTSQEKLRTTLEACAELGLYYYVKNDPGNEPPEIVSVLIFFDAAGRDAYLTDHSESR